LDLETLQRKLVRDRRGGYCFEHNSLFAAVLEEIGFGLTRLAARVRHGSHVTPRTHMVLRVEAEGTVWLADVGFGAVSILEPLPFEPGPAVDQHGWRFRLVQAEDGARVLQASRSEGWLDHYAFTLEPQHPVDYEVANHYTSTHPDSRFTRTLTVQRSWSDRALILRGRTLTEVTPSGETETQIDPGDLLEVLATRFDLVFPEGTPLTV